MGPPNGVLQGGSKVLPAGVRARDVARALVGTEAFEQSRRDRIPGAASPSARTSCDHCLPPRTKVGPEIKAGEPVFVPAEYALAPTAFVRRSCATVTLAKH